MEKLNFKTWLEWADYGNDRKGQKTGPSQPEGEDPIKPIDSHVIIDELKRLPVGTSRARQKWDEVLEWGSNVGALQIDVSPLGSYKIVTRRKIKDLKGEETWICKAVFPLDEDKHHEGEIGLAMEIHKKLESVSKKMIEGPKKEFDGLEKLANRLWAAVKREHPDYCMFPIALRRQNDDYYKMVFEFRGHGVEAPTAARAEQFDIDLFWDKKKGLIRCWGYDIDSQMRRHDWRPQPSEWDEYFSPGQDPEEIVESVVKIFLTY